MNDKYPVQVRSGNELVHEVAPLIFDDATLKDRSSQVITRISPAYRNQVGMFGFVEFSRSQWSEGDVIPKHAIDSWDKDAVDDELRVKPGYQLSLDALLGVIEVPGSVIEGLKEGKRGRANRDKVFINSFKIQDDYPDDITKSQFEGIPFENGENYYPCFHPPTGPAEMESLDELTQQTGRYLRVVVGYLFRMQEWVNHARSEDWGKTKLEYSEFAERPVIGKATLPLLES